MLTAGRTVFGSLALAAFALLLKSSLRPHRRRDLFMMMLAGAILATHWFTFFLSIQVSTVAIGLLGFATFPLFVTFLELVVFGERLHRYDVIGGPGRRGGVGLGDAELRCGQPPRGCWGGCSRPSPSPCLRS